MAHILLLSIGSSGDVYPFIGLGIALQERGHRATLIANEHFETLARSEGLGFAAMGTTEQYAEAVRHPDAWDRRRGSQALGPFAISAMRDGFRSIQRLYNQDDTIVVGSRYSFAALLAKAKFNLPTVTLLLNLPSLRSIYSPPCIPSVPLLQQFGPNAAKLVFRAMDHKYQRLFRPSINQFRAEIGLPPIKNLHDWWNSADLLIASWPEWLYGPQRDWPSHAVCSGFIDYDGRDAAHADPFRDPGNSRQFEHSIVFTAGTPVTQAHDFFRAATEACLTLKLPGVFLSQCREQISGSLPSCIRHVPYAPLSALLPKTLALVHTGGIGTAARAVKSGIPQLIMPMCHDQFENAQRFVKLGVAKSFSGDKASASVMVKLLKELLQSQAIAERCRFWADALQRTRAVSQICELIENMSTGQNMQRSLVAG